MKNGSITPRKCIFCGSRKNITREHVVPNWLRHVIPRVSDEYLHANFTLHPALMGPNTVAIVPQMNPAKRNIGNRQLFMVCETCNTGWMHQLQDELMPVLKPLIRGDWSHFDAQSASRIGSWLAMTVTVIAMSMPQTRGVTRLERSLIYSNKEPPENWRMWIGRGSGFTEIDYCNRVWTMVPRSELGKCKPEPNILITTIALGQLILHCVSVPRPDLVPDSTIYGDDLGVFPIIPWGGGSRDWRLTPIIHNGSEEWSRLRDTFAHSFMRLMHRG